MARREKPGEIPRRPDQSGAPRNDKLAWEGTQAVAGEGKNTLAEASRDRLARRVADRELWEEFTKATGERVDPLRPPTWAELIAAQQARRAATSDTGTRDAKELRDAAEGPKSDVARVAFLLSLDGLPKTNAVSGKTTV